MAYWLKINEIPHPETQVFARKEDAVEYLKNAELPVVLKTNIGAGSSGVDVVKSRSRAIQMAKKIFGRFHPALTIGRIRFSRKFYGIPLPLFGRIQKHYLIVQKYYDIRWEWRMIRIGDSYAGHKKLLKGKYASGSDRIGWVKPPDELLELARKICEKGNFDSMAIDIFETVDGQYLVNELQAIYGSYAPFQLKINDIPGRYVYENGHFTFEQGEFYQYGSNILRVNRFIELLQREN
jgi:glutathione synthase/RimK-type ligase-like ATP-grasp enzyme